MSRPAVRTHGEYGYAQRTRCKCDPCIKARRRYQKLLYVDHQRGKKRRVPAEPVRAHIKQLMGYGYEPYQIAGAAGIARTVVRHILHGNPNQGGKTVEYLLPTTAEKLLNVYWRDCEEWVAYVPSVGVHRRLEALQYMGHSLMDIAAALDVSFSAVYRWLKTTQSKTSTIEKLAKVYDELSMVRGESEFARWNAYRLGWLPPMAWDEDTIDDPNAEPDLTMVVCIVDGCSRRLFKASLCVRHYEQTVQMRGFEAKRRYKLAVDRLSAQKPNDKASLLASLSNLKELGYTPAQAALRLGRKDSYIKKIWNEAA